MRINRNILMRLAQDYVDRQTQRDRALLSVYLCGSLLEDEYMLGGTADIDLVFVHTDAVQVEREIVPLNEDIHLDIAHHLHRDYRQARRLRNHPWLGPTLSSCQVLYDPQHFLDFTKASVRGQFDRPDNVVARARSQLDHARQVWQEFHARRPAAGPEEVASYLRAVEHAANSIALLSGPPLTERRFLVRYPARADAVKKPGLYAGLLGLLGAPNIDADALASWLPGWQAAFEEVAHAGNSTRLHADRMTYYSKAFDALLKGKQPLAALWPLVRTWTIAVSHLPADASQKLAWEAAFQKLGLLGAGFAERVDAFDAYLDLVEETLEDWAAANGA